MWIFNMFEMIIVYVSLLRCNQSPVLFDGNPWASICIQTVDDLWFWIPKIILIFINACAAFAACGMKYKVQQTSDPGISGGSGAFFG